MVFFYCRHVAIYMIIDILYSNDIHGLHFKSLESFTELRDISLRGNKFVPESPHLDIVPIIAYVLPSVRLVDGKAVTTRQREAAHVLFSNENHELLNPGREFDLVVFLSKKG